MNVDGIVSHKFSDKHIELTISSSKSVFSTSVELPHALRSLDTKTL